MNFDAESYGPEVAAVLALARKPAMNRLVASASPSAELIRRIQPGLFEGSAHPQAALSGLWLYFDCFEEAHKIAQEDGSREGSLWHGIAHRREPDFPNANYWFQKAGSHPVFPRILEAAKLVPGGRIMLPKWDPQMFTAICEDESEGGEASEYTLAVQRVEWQVLFDYCAGKSSD